MRVKATVSPCRFCQKQFRRTEHLLRHERTHTKEKPFACACGKAFSRRDLLSRHERLAHEFQEYGDIDIVVSTNTSSMASHTPATPTTGPTQPLNNYCAGDRNEDNIPADQIEPHAFVQYPRHVYNPPADPQGGLIRSTEGQSEPRRVGAEATVNTYNSVTDVSAHLNLASTSDSALFNELDMLWSDFDKNSALIFPNSHATNYPPNFLPLSPYGILDPGAADTRVNSRPDRVHESSILSRYASRLPSPQPDSEQQQGQRPSLQSATHLGAQLQITSDTDPATPWRVSREDYWLILAMFHSLGPVLPVDFAFPSRHALCRYVEGFFSGFHEHLPFLHLPTISVVSAAPELILAIAAAGALYRFQRAPGWRIYAAARALLEHQIHRRDAYGASYSDGETPSTLLESHLASNSSASTRDYATQQEAEVIVSGLEDTRNSARNCAVETMQAMIILIALGTWNHRSLLKDAFSLAGQLALLVREDGLLVPDTHNPDLDWRQWIQAEGRRRTKIVAYCFLNLHCVAYNIPPKLMNKEISLLSLPLPESQWKAKTKNDWLAVRSRDPWSEISIHDGYLRLFDTGTHNPALSSFGNYVLIHCVFQQIFIVQQSTFDLGHDNAILPDKTITRFQAALRGWQRNWEATKDSSIDPSSPGGPLSFNSTALFRVAHIRLHTDIGPCRELETRDPGRIARAFQLAPFPKRSSHVCGAVLQSAHALSIPVRIGIEFVARTQTLTWSIVHSLCNLDCAFFLTKWLESMAAIVITGQEMSEDEKRILGIVGSILSETELNTAIQLEADHGRRIKRMAAAVARLWAETFKGAHVFTIMGSIGAGIETYAEMLEKELVAS